MKKLIPFLLMAVISGSSSGQLPKKSETVNVNGIKLYYEVYGQGEALVLLHGWTQSSQFWDAYISTFSNYFEVYAVDLRGHGKSSPLTSEFTIKKAAEDITQLLDHLGIKKANTIGLSFGGQILLELAHANPEKIASMVLIGTSHNYNGGENSKLDDSFSYENLPASFIAGLNKIHHHGEDQIKAMFNRELNYCINLKIDDLKAINSKTLIIHGDRDEILGVEPAITLHEFLPNSELWIIPNTGHIAINDANRDQFLKTSLSFLQIQIERK